MWLPRTYVALECINADNHGALQTDGLKFKPQSPIGSQNQGRPGPIFVTVSAVGVCCPVVCPMSMDGDAAHWNLPGTPASQLWAWKVTDPDQSEGAFAAQEYIQDLIRQNPSDLNKLLTVPSNQDSSVWVLEHIRQILLELNHFTAFIGDDCSAETCPKMVAAKWEFLCAAHKKPQDCCAIDYILHTLNGFTGLVNNKSIFPSRVRIPPKSQQFFQSIPRRLARVFAHVFFHHRELFDKFEHRTYLCSRFVALVTKFKLLQRQHIIIPVEQLPIS